MVKITPDLEQKYTDYQLDKLRMHRPAWRSCPECGKRFDAQSYIFRPTAIYPRINEFCSSECKKKGAGKKNKKVFRTYVCKGCNDPFVPHKAKPHQQYCSHHCYTNSLKGKPRKAIYRWIHKIKPPKGSVSNAEREWLAQFDITHVQHYLCIDGKTFCVDGFDAKTNTIYEFLGSFWHGNPALYDPNEIHPVCKVPYHALYKNTLERLQLFENSGYNVVYKWSDC